MNVGEFGRTKIKIKELKVKLQHINITVYIVEKNSLFTEIRKENSVVMIAT